jgi:hypothetical protein
MTKKNEKRSFVMYDSFLEAMKHLNDAEFRECVLKIRDYALEGVDEESSSPMVNVIMAMAKPNLDSAKRRYMASVENGKKGAEYGKLGGAPKGNQNARKNNPQSTPKRPLDVDVNEDVEEDVNENEEVDVNVNAPVGDIVPSSFSCFSSSSVPCTHQEPPREAPSHSNTQSIEAEQTNKGETSQYSKTNSSSNPPVGIGSEKDAESFAARPHRRTIKGGAYDQGEYYQLCLNNYVLDLADMRLGILPSEDGLFWQAVDLYKALYGKSNDEAIKTISSTVNEIVQQKK